MSIENKDPTHETASEEQPEVYAVSREETGVHFTRREFVELVGTATAGVVIISSLGLSQQSVMAQGATPTRTPRPTSTPRPTRTATPIPCTVRTDQDDVAVHVGPGRNRGIRRFMPVDEAVPVIGQGRDSDNNLWWQIELPKIEQAWVSDEDVEFSGDCSDVPLTPTPAIATAQSRETATPRATDRPPGDIGSVGPGQTGINYSVNGVTYTLPCGSPIPAGAVCTCNCVTVPRSCSCDGVCSCAGETHYWYPN